jgi:vacuolar iron transporter family protein
MPQTPHTETHFTGGELVRDIVIGMSDGLTVPFALAAGLSGAVSSSHVVVVAGLAEIAAGSIAMGLGGFLAARSDAEHYEQELLREKREVETIPEDEAKEVVDIFERHGLTQEECQPVVNALRSKPKAWVDFMMRFELGWRSRTPDAPYAARSPLPLPILWEASFLFALHTYLASSLGLAAFDGGHSCCALYFRLRQSPFHWSPRPSRRPADSHHWRSRRWCRLPDRTVDFLRPSGIDVRRQHRCATLR